MLIKIWLKYMLGYLRISVEGYYIERFINICTMNKILIWNLKREKNVKLHLNIGVQDFYRAINVAKKLQCKVKIEKKRGIPFIINKYKKRKIFLISLLIVMVGLILVSGTYAKYTTKFTGSDTATVAKFKVSSNTTAETFDLFKTAKEVDGTTADAEVVNGKVAPGTGGKFDIQLTNDSEVKVHYAISLKETNESNIPIEYSLDGTTYVTAANFASVSADDLAIGSTTQQTKTVSVYWRWAFEGKDSTNYTTTQTDTTDYTLGTASTAPTVKVEVSTVFTQVD